MTAGTKCKEPDWVCAELCVFNFYVSVGRIPDLGVIRTQKTGLRTLYRRNKRCESQGEIFMNPRPEDVISSAWKPDLPRQANFFDEKHIQFRL